MRSHEQLQLVPPQELVGQVPPEQDASVAATRLVHAVRVVGVRVRPEEVEEEVVLEGARRLGALLPRVQPSELLQCDASVAPATGRAGAQRG